jgi:hypothetical protein
VPPPLESKQIDSIGVVKDISPPIPSFLKDLHYPSMPKPTDRLIYPIINEKILPDMAPFRGRARIGRGGRLIFDRKPDFRQTNEDSNQLQAVSHGYDEILPPR